MEPEYEDNIKVLMEELERRSRGLQSANDKMGVLYKAMDEIARIAREALAQATRL